MSDRHAPLGVEPLESRRFLSAGGPGSSVPPTPVTRVPFANASFEAFPDFTGWKTAGNDTVAASDFLPAPDGSAQAVISNSAASVSGTAPASASDLASFLGVSANALDANNSPKGQAVNGSAIKQTITVRAGDVVTFKADVLTNEPAKGGNADYAFVSVTLSNSNKTVIVPLSTFLKPADTLTQQSTGFNRASGYHTYSLRLPVSGQYTIGFGVVNVGDANVSTALAVDNVQLAPKGNEGNGHGDGHGDDDNGDGQGNGNGNGHDGKKHDDGTDDDDVTTAAVLA